MSNVTNNTAVEDARTITTEEELSLPRACSPPSRALVDMVESVDKG